MRIASEGSELVDTFSFTTLAYPILACSRFSFGLGLPWHFRQRLGRDCVADRRIDNALQRIVRMFLRSELGIVRVERTVDLGGRGVVRKRHDLPIGQLYILSHTASAVAG